MNKSVPLLYRIGKTVLGPIFKIYYNPQIEGKENILNQEPIIIAGNHKHLYDQCLTIIATNRGIHYMAKKEYFDNKKTAWFFKSVGCISVNRQVKDPKAVQMGINVLKDKGALGIFPEGTRNKTSKILLPFKYGAVSMAKKTNSYIVPFGIIGDYKFRSKNLKIKYGKPFKVNNMTLEQANTKLFNEVLFLMK